MTSRELSDREIVERVLAGDREHFRLLVERHRGLVFRQVRRVVRGEEWIEDLAQESFIKAYTRLDRYDPRWAFTTWLATIATRTALNALRSEVRRNGTDPEELYRWTLPAQADDNPREQLSRRQWLEALGREVERLGEKMRLVFGLRHEDGCSINEIASITGQSVSAVKVTLHRARQRLREGLAEAGVELPEKEK